MVNISEQETGEILSNAIFDIANDLLIHKNEEVYGYQIDDEKVIFTYTHDKNLDSSLVKSISVAGPFNDWNSENKAYQTTRKNSSTFELVIPKSQFQKGKEYQFKLVINNTRWISAPNYAKNTNQTQDKNLILKLE
jgi:hypothetical protein